MAKFYGHCVLCLYKLTKLKNEISRFARQSKVSSTNIQLGSEKEVQIVQIQVWGFFYYYLFELQEKACKTEPL